ncbi:putative LRR receptor-like serine/threonine-protein kinase [Iris pallida]|uniref:LRR receptor-like serine/threonine-protein kinase n=1 Tax=Iris pallida TaxID=29817 RepID=A0AAX6GAC0_IRIPA|nr:putative LRR receptor-like serine/threonine-protein kinase [Iris pallida]
MLLLRRRFQTLLLHHRHHPLNPNNPPLLRLLSATTPPPPSTTTTTEQQWTEEIVYLDESDNLLSSSPGARPSDTHLISSGSVLHPIPPSSAADRVAHLALRWRWGPQLDSALDSSSLPPSLFPLALARLLRLSDPSDHLPPLSLLRWARRQPWFLSSSAPLLDDSLSLLLDRLHHDDIHSLFQDFILPNQETATTTTPPPPSFPSLAANKALQSLSHSGHLELSFSNFKKLKHLGLDGLLHTRTYNSLIHLFLAKGLPYKAFEIYESMAASASCSLDASTYELMIPALAKSGRLDAALKLFQALKEEKDGPSPPGFPIYSALVDSMGKAGRLDAAVGLYREMQAAGYKPSAAMYVSMIESLVKAGKLDAGKGLWDEMKGFGFRPNFGLYTMMVEAHAKSGRLEVASALFTDMEKAGFLPTPSSYSCLIEMHSAAGQVDAVMRLYNSMTGAGFRLGMSIYTCMLTLLANKKLLDLAAKILLEMKANGFSVDVNASDVLMIYIKEGSTDLALRWLRFMGSAGIRTNNFIVRQLFESCMKAGIYDSARPLLETYVGSAAKVDLILYTSILAHLVRCQDEKNERAIMDIMSVTRHKAHEFMCGLFTGPEQRKKPVLSFVREFFQGIDYEAEESAARYFVNVLLNYLVLMGQMNRARCVWKVAYENKLFPKAIVFDQHIAWSLDIRNLSVGAALVAVVHTLHRFRKRMLYYGVVPRRIKLVTGPTLKMVVAQVLESVESPFEVSKVVLRAPGDSVLEWFKKPIVQQFLLNEIPSKGDVLMHKLNVMFPSSAPEVRSLSPPKPSSFSKVMY